MLHAFKITILSVILLVIQGCSALNATFGTVAYFGADELPDTQIANLVTNSSRVPDVLMGHDFDARIMAMIVSIDGERKACFRCKVPAGIHAIELVNTASGWTPKTFYINTEGGKRYDISYNTGMVYVRDNTQNLPTDYIGSKIKYPYKPYIRQQDGVIMALPTAHARTSSPFF